MKKGLNLLSSGFFVVGSNDGRATFNTLFSDDAAKAHADADEETGDKIQVWDNSIGYVNYFFYTSNGADGEEYDDKWYAVTDDSAPTQETLDAGAGFWYRNRGDSDIQLTVSGEVSKNAQTVTVEDGLNLIANPFPVDLKLNGGTINWVAAGAHADADEETGDKIQIWDPTEGYVNYFFYTSNGADGEEYDNKWYSVQDDSAPTTDTIPAGRGFWYRNRSGKSFDLTIASPIAE